MTEHRPDATRAVLVVDAANVVGARPDGWWKDRAGAAARLLTALAAATARGAAPELGERRVVVVLEGQAMAAAPDGWDGLDVVLAERDGDGAVVEVVAGLREVDVVVVTSDRELRGRVEALGAHTRGAGWLRTILDEVGA